MFRLLPDLWQFIYIYSVQRYRNKIAHVHTPGWGGARGMYIHLKLFGLQFQALASLSPKNKPVMNRGSFIENVAPF